MPAKRRPRSTATESTTSARRPQSRGSTTSIQDVVPPSMQEVNNTATSNYVPTHPIVYNAPAPFAGLDMQHQHHNTDLDPQMAALYQHNNEAAELERRQQQSFLPQHLQTADSFDQMSGVNYAESQASAPMPTENEGKRKPAIANASNDKELREMVARSEGKGLKELASDVLATERTSKAEKTKQLFAMIWLRSACRQAKTSVPRSRVYTTYADRCGDLRINPLNPASFGKLVRVIFPGLQTRRLGVRGESKYHYVDLALVDDAGQESYDLYDRRVSQAPELRPTSQNMHQNAVLDFNPNSHVPTVGSTTGLPEGTSSTQKPPNPRKRPHSPAGSASRGRLFAEPYLSGVNTRSGTTSHTYSQTLKFPSPNEPVDESDNIELPNIHDYVPPKTDIDAAMSLAALYRSHVTSLVDCIRFCREKQFFRLYATFGGTLTVPVHKLFDHPDMAPWIRECDWLMYQKMTYYISQLTLSVVPEVVLRFLDTISKTLHTHITKIFVDKPLHVLEARLEPATLFAGLLHRMLRVNQAAHAAAALLLTDQYRDQMWQDWVAFVNPKRVMESELPDCGYEETYKILTYDVRTLLQPLNTYPGMETGTPYEDAAIALQQVNFNASISPESVIERIAGFLAQLPSRFPGATTRTMLQCISSVSTACLREITVENGTSYNPWWITKVFIDEMALWLASLGGFLDHKPPVAVRGLALNGPFVSQTNSRSQSRNEHRSQTGSVASPMMATFGQANGNGTNGEGEAVILQASYPVTGTQQIPHPQGQSQSQPAFVPIQAKPPAPPMKNDSLADESSHDDSGLGMSLIDDPSMYMSKMETANGLTYEESVASFNHAGLTLGS